MSDALFQSMNVHGVKKITVGKTEGDYNWRTITIVGENFEFTVTVFPENDDEVVEVVNPS